MNDFLPMFDENGYFGEYGGQILPPELQAVMNQRIEEMSPHTFGQETRN